MFTFTNKNLKRVKMTGYIINDKKVIHCTFTHSNTDNYVFFLIENGGETKRGEPYFINKEHKTFIREYADNVHEVDERVLYSDYFGNSVEGLQEWHEEYSEMIFELNQPHNLNYIKNYSYVIYEDVDMDSATLQYLQTSTSTTPVEIIKNNKETTRFKTFFLPLLTQIIEKELGL